LRALPFRFLGRRGNAPPKQKTFGGIMTTFSLAAVLVLTLPERVLATLTRRDAHSLIACLGQLPRTPQVEAALNVLLRQTARDERACDEPHHLH
jgi:hypothetical protein